MKKEKIIKEPASVHIWEIVAFLAIGLALWFLFNVTGIVEDVARWIDSL